MARLHGEAVTLIAEIAAELDGDPKTLPQTCGYAAQRLRVRIEVANAIANGEALPSQSETEVGGQAAIDALFGTR
ncbi:MAG TPA: hypothetical protein VFR71_07530 [Methyloceanibacter sp.]|nr:hypothetical protein [Methyloceanibacter sp.]